MPSASTFKREYGLHEGRTLSVPLQGEGKGRSQPSSSSRSAVGGGNGESKAAAPGKASKATSKKAKKLENEAIAASTASPSAAGSFPAAAAAAAHAAATGPSSSPSSPSSAALFTLTSVSVGHEPKTAYERYEFPTTLVLELELQGGEREDPHEADGAGDEGGPETRPQEVGHGGQRKGKRKRHLAADTTSKRTRRPCSPSAGSDLNLDLDLAVPSPEAVLQAVVHDLLPSSPTKLVYSEYGSPYDCSWKKGTKVSSVSDGGRKVTITATGVALRNHELPTQAQLAKEAEAEEATASEGTGKGHSTKGKRKGTASTTAATSSASSPPPSSSSHAFAVSEADRSRLAHTHRVLKSHFSTGTCGICGEGIQVGVWIAQPKTGASASISSSASSAAPAPAPTAARGKGKGNAKGKGKSKGSSWSHAACALQTTDSKGT